MKIGPPFPSIFGSGTYLNLREWGEEGQYPSKNELCPPSFTQVSGGVVNQVVSCKMFKCH